MCRSYKWSYMMFAVRLDPNVSKHYNFIITLKLIKSFFQYFFWIFIIT